MTESTCDKGPVLTQLLESVSELKNDSKRMVDALVEIAKHQERLIALADRAKENHNNIEHLYQLHHQGEAQLQTLAQRLDDRITKHLLNHPCPESCKNNKVFSVDNNGKFDKVQVAVVLALTYFLANQAWLLIAGLVQAVRQMGGSS